MANSNLVPTRPISDASRFPRVSVYQVSAVERQLLGDALRAYLVFTDGEFPQDVARQDLLARIVADRTLRQAAPGLSRLFESVRANLIDCIYVTNLPTEKSIASLLLLTLSSALGKAFNYASSDGDTLIMHESSDQTSADKRRTEQEWHTDGACVPREYRVEWICILGCDNTTDIYTSYAPIIQVERLLSARTKNKLYSQPACFRASTRSNLAFVELSKQSSILLLSPCGEVEIAWPNCAISSPCSDDREYIEALKELVAEICRQHFVLSMDAGCFVAFNNFRGVHSQSPAGERDRGLHKAYARRSLSKLQQSTGEPGPIFALKKAISDTPLGPWHTPLGREIPCQDRYCTEIK